MKYAGFWPRLGASIIDLLVLVPCVLLANWSLSTSHSIAVLFFWPLAFLFDFYSIYSVGRWGQTIGKMAFRIKVMSLNGDDAGMLRAFYRNSIDLTLSVLTSCLTFYALLSIPSNEYNILSSDVKIQRMSDLTYSWDKVIMYISLIWAISELIVLLTNKKRRALHDFIAGTVVIHKEK
jgi:uncharacterized RDD family membrane protein YckC